MSITYRIGAVLRALKGKRRPYTTAIILAGGVGSRMHSEDGLTKQLMLLDGVPVLMRSAIAYENSEYIDEIVIVARKEELSDVALLAKEYGLTKLARIVSGGKTRRLSALRGLRSVSKQTKFVAFHDAARCLVTPKMIASVASSAYAVRAASAGCVSTDTVKRVNENGYIVETLDRNYIYKAQTPQIFEIGLYRAAAYSAKDDEGITDDNMLLESIGQAVKIIDTGTENIKLTTPLDFKIAEAILATRREK